MGSPTDSEIRYYDGRKLKSLEFEEQARARQLVRGGHLLIVGGTLSAPFERGFLEHAAKTPSQYDSTCRRMAAQILSLTPTEHRHGFGPCLPPCPGYGEPDAP